MLENINLLEVGLTVGTKVNGVVVPEEVVGANVPPCKVISGNGVCI
jgi:hypothetical protein